VLGQLPVLVSFAQRHDLDLTLDTCHVGTMGDVSLCEAYGAVADLVNNIHYSDLKRMRVPLGSDFFRTLLSHHQLPGEGDLPLQGLVNQLVRDAYAGPLTFEIGAYALRAWSLARAQARLTRAVHQVRASAAASTPVWCEANPSMSLSGE
jgi:sugar phosphate isomerase/epimerase